jgi:hypothetical protein
VYVEFFFSKKKKKKRGKRFRSAFIMFHAELFIDTVFVTTSIKRGLLGITPVFGDSQNYVIPLARSPHSRDGIGLNPKI